MGTCSEQLNGGRAGEEGVGSGRVQEVIQAECGGLVQRVRGSQKVLAWKTPTQNTRKKKVGDSGH